MGTVQLDGVIAGGVGTPGRLTECVDDLLQTGRVERLRRVQPGEDRLVGDAHGLPAALVRGHGAAGLVGQPRIGGRLAAGMAQLGGDGRALGVDEVDDAGMHLLLLVVPQADVARRDPAARFHGRRLGGHQAEAPGRQRAVVLQVPVERHAVVRVDDVLAHRRHDRAIAQGQAVAGGRGDGQWREERRCHEGCLCWSGTV